MDDALDHDSPWKETLGRFLQPFLELTFPKIAGRIDWSVQPVSLERNRPALPFGWGRNGLDWWL